MTKIRSGRTGSSPTDATGPVGAADGALSGLVARMADELVEAKNLVVAARDEEGRLAKQAEVAAGAAQQWGQRAMSAVRAGDDVVARDALVRRREYERKADEFRSAHGEQKREVERLKALLSERSLLLEGVKHRKNAVLLRARRSGAGPSLDAAATQAEGASALDLLARLETLVAAAERQGAVDRELSDEAIRSSSEAVVDERRIEADLQLLKRLAKAPSFATTKPLAKTKGGASDAESPRADAGATRERRTKR